MKASLQRFGQVVPIVRAPDGWIISGNTTLRAMDDLGFDTCAVVTLDAEEADQVAWGLASNRIGQLGQDDEAKVLALLSDLDVLDGTGYTVDDFSDLQALMAEVQRADLTIANPMERIAPSEFPGFDPLAETAYRCPSCQYEWNGSAR